MVLSSVFVFPCATALLHWPALAPSALSMIGAVLMQALHASGTMRTATSSLRVRCRQGFTRTAGRQTSSSGYLDSLTKLHPQCECLAYRASGHNPRMQAIQPHNRQTSTYRHQSAVATKTSMAAVLDLAKISAGSLGPSDRFSRNMLTLTKGYGSTPTLRSYKPPAN